MAAGDVYADGFKRTADGALYVTFDSSTTPILATGIILGPATNVLLKSDAAGGLLVRNAADSAAAPITASVGTLSSLAVTKTTVGAADVAHFTNTNASAQGVRIYTGANVSGVMTGANLSGIGIYFSSTQAKLYAGGDILAAGTTGVGVGTLVYGAAATVAGAFDVGLSRVAAGVYGVGTGAAASTAGTLRAAALAAGGSDFTVTAVNAVSPTSPDRTITISYNGTTYYLAAKTTNN